jgi:hypothetical protein
LFGRREKKIGTPKKRKKKGRMKSRFPDAFVDGV